MNELKTPLFIGITGHRKIDDHHLIEEAIGRVIDDKIKPIVSDKQGNAKPYSMVGISPLAEGSDRLFANQFLSQSDRVLSVVLPFDKNQYITSFKGIQDTKGKQIGSKEDSIKEFETLLEKDDDYLELAEFRVAGAAQMNKYYYLAGKYVVDNCDVMIAVWNGQPADGHGGTTEIIDYAKSIGKPIFIIDSISGEVIPGENTATFAYPTLPEEAPLKGKLKTAYNESKADLENILNEAEDYHVNLETFNQIIDEYAKLDALAQHNKWWYRGKGVVVFALAFASLFFGVLGILIPLKSVIFHSVELFLLISIIGIHDHAKQNKNQQKWLSYRVLAEKLRVGVFRLLTLGALSPHFFQKHYTLYRNDGGWIFRHYYQILSRAQLRITITQSPQERAMMVVRNLLAPQIEHHESNHKKRSRLHHVLETISEGIPIAAIVTVLIILIAHALFHYIPCMKNHTFEIVVFSIALMLPGLFASIEGVTSFLEHERVSGRNARMITTLGELKTLFEHCKTEEELRHLMNQLEKIMLFDNMEWQELLKYGKVPAVA